PEAGEVGADRRFVEGLDAEADVVQVAAFRPRRRAAGAPELAVDGHEVDQRAAGAQLHEADLVLAPLDRAAQPLAIETQDAREVGDAQDDVVDFADVDHGWRLAGRGGSGAPRDRFAAPRSRPVVLRAAPKRASLPRTAAGAWRRVSPRSGAAGPAGRGVPPAPGSTSARRA